MKYTTLLFVSLVAHAGTITTLYSTGVAPVDGIDSHWTVNGGSAFVTDASGWPFAGGTPWIADTAQSAWISPSASYAGGGSDPGGFYIFSTQFNLTGYDLSTVSIIVHAAVDNQITNLLLNGVSVHVSAPINGFVLELPFTLTSGFSQGWNRLDFVTLNIPQDTPNPNGLNVRFESSGEPVIPSVPAEVPEPAVGLLVGAGLGLAGLSALLRELRG